MKKRLVAMLLCVALLVAFPATAFAQTNPPAARCMPAPAGQAQMLRLQVMVMQANAEIDLLVLWATTMWTGCSARWTASPAAYLITPTASALRWSAITNPIGLTARWCWWTRCASSTYKTGKGDKTFRTFPAHPL